MLLKFGSHIVLIGRTETGKTWLMSEILALSDSLFDRKTHENIAFVLSPHPTCEVESVLHQSHKWTIHHKQVKEITDEELDAVLAFVDETYGLYGEREIIFLIDDLGFKGQFSSRSAEALVRAFATFRHFNISVVASLQLHNAAFYDLISNSAYVVVMNALGQNKILTNIIRYYIRSTNVQAIVDFIKSRFNNAKVGDYIAICLSPAASANKAFTIVDNIFSPQGGIYRKELESRK